jgi:hypothetical protein
MSLLDIATHKVTIYIIQNFITINITVIVVLELILGGNRTTTKNRLQM